MQGTVTSVGQKHANMGGYYKKARRWRVEEQHRFITAQLYPTSAQSGTGYKEQFQQVLLIHLFTLLLFNISLIIQYCNMQFHECNMRTTRSLCSNYWSAVGHPFVALQP